MKSISCDDNQADCQKSSLISRNITVMGRRTSIRLEPELWRGIKEIAAREKCSIHDICTLIALRKKENSSLTASIRVFIMLYFKAGCTEEGHGRANHGSFAKMVKRAKINEVEAQFFSELTWVPGVVSRQVSSLKAERKMAH
ncbi:MAG: ribbon-helix-helix domain-containing protein [Alphaproteobacteria bacterium]